MSRVVYIGDEAHAAAWRLVGIEVRVAVAEDDVGRLLDEAGANADLVLLAESSAARLPASTRDRWRQSLAPLWLVLPSAATLAAGSELAQRVRSQLGMEP